MLKYAAKLKHRGSLQGIVTKIFTSKEEARKYATHYNYSILTLQAVRMSEVRRWKY